MNYYSYNVYQNYYALVYNTCTHIFKYCQVVESAALLTNREVIHQFIGDLVNAMRDYTPEHRWRNGGGGGAGRVRAPPPPLKDGG